MPLTEQIRKRIIGWYCIIFYALFLYKLCHGLLLFQVKPILFTTRFDVVAWLFMKTGIHQLLLKHSSALILFDFAFYSMPLLYWLACKKNNTLATVIAAGMLCINWLYIQTFTLYPTNSIEGFTPWLLFPFLLLCTSLKSFYFVFTALRYFLLYFFVSAALWKVAQGGLFHIEQMSGILLYQHKEYLTSSPTHWYTLLIYWFISHPTLSYPLYLAAALLELFFIVGFFTRKLDKILVAAFILFLITDLFFMRISYIEITPLILTLLFSKYKGFSKI